MRTLSHHKSNRKFIFRIVAIALFIIGFGFLIPKAISAISMSITYPIHGVNIWFNKSSDFIPTLFRERQKMQEKIDELENELIIQGNADLTRQRLIEENLQLRQLLGSGDQDRIAATVIARPNQLPYDLLQIDRGSNHGVEVGAPVFVGSDIVIGLVVHTGNNFSFVQMITSPSFEASVFISGPNIAATIEGLGGGQSRVRVPQGIPISVGNLVYLPSIEPGVFGRISYVESRPTQPEQYGYVTPDIAISSLHYVAVGSQSQITKSIKEIDEKILNNIKTELLFKDILNNIKSTSSTSSREDTQEIISAP